MQYIICPITHGVQLGEVQQDFASPLIDGIRNALNSNEKGYFVPLPYNYTTRTAKRQETMFLAVEQGLGNQTLRKLKHTIGSDITWSFILAKDGKECFYRDFVKDVTVLVDKAIYTYPQSKTLFIGHSQGTQLLYSFFFDFPKVVDCFVSLGSPISMNSGGYPDYGQVPKTLKSWINFYHNMDFVSSRLQGVHPSKQIADFVIDYEVQADWWKILYKMNLKMALGVGVTAHVSYWKSPYVHKIIAEKIKELMYQPEIKK